MTTIREAFLADICEHPEDDSPRLIFADWLEDNGDPDRAAFIRAQIELDGTLCVHADDADNAYCNNSPCRHCELDRRASGILGPWPHDNVCSRCDWHVPLDRDCCFLWEFRRGFVHRVWCSLGAWEQHGPAIVRGQPVERVTLTDRSPIKRSKRSSGWAYFNCAEGRLRRQASGDFGYDEDDIPHYITGGSPDCCDWEPQFATEGEAVEWLSGRLLLWARTHPVLPK